MSKICPITSKKVIYLDCLECEYRKLCLSNPKKLKKIFLAENKKIVISKVKKGEKKWEERIVIFLLLFLQ